MKKAHVLFFDLDGTLLDTVADLGAAVNTILEKYNYPTHELSEYVNFIGQGSMYLIRKASGEKDEDKIKILYKEYLANLLDNLYNRTNSYPYIASALEKFSISGYELFVFTNKPQKAAENLMKYFFKNVKFKAVIGQGEKKFPPKPDPTGLLETLKEYEIDPQDVIYFGDSNYDMLVAKKCNIPYRIGCLYGYQNEELLIEGGATDIIPSGRYFFKIVNKYGFSKSISISILFNLLELFLIGIFIFMALTSSKSNISYILYALAFLTGGYVLVTDALTFTDVHFLEPNLLFCFTSVFISSALYIYLFSNAFFNFSWNAVNIIFFLCSIIFTIIFILSFYALVKNGINDIARAKKRKENLNKSVNKL